MLHAPRLSPSLQIVAELRAFGTKGESGKMGLQLSLMVEVIGDDTVDISNLTIAQLPGRYGTPAALIIIARLIRADSAQSCSHFCIHHS
jgi:hypothetical protein